MANRNELLAAIDQAFEECGPLEVYTDIHHCPECAESNALLKQHTPQSIVKMEDTDLLWTALCLSGNHATKHFMPGLARLSMRNGFLDLDLTGFTGRLAPDLISELSEPQLRSLLGWLQYLRELNTDELDTEGTKVIDRRIKRINRELAASEGLGRR